MFALGIMGEYISRIFLRNMDRPVYTIKEELHSSLELAQLAARYNDKEIS
jgi:hypothetical protein